MAKEKPWSQEPLWVKRDSNGAIVGVRETPPENEDFIPSIPVEQK